MKTPTSFQNSCLASLSSLLLFSASANAVNVDFNNPTDFADNFRIYSNSSSISTAQSGTSVQVTGATFATSPSIYFYDATPSDGLTTRSTFALGIGQTLNFSVDVASITGAASSLGFYFVNSSQALTASAHNLALLNFNNSGADELARFATYASMSGQSLSNGTPSAGDGISLNNPTFQTVTATYTRISNQNIEMTLNVGGFTSTFTNTNFASYSNVEVGFRLFPSTASPTPNSFLFDNFNASIVPEPSALTLVAVGLIGGLLSFRRRQVSDWREV